MIGRTAICFVLAALTASFAGVGSASAAAPTVAIDPTPTAAYTTIQVSGMVDPQDHGTSVYAEYATAPGGPYEYTFVAFLPEGEGPTPVSGQITGLQPGTKYFVRLGAENGLDPEIFSSEPNPAATTLAVEPPTVSVDPVTVFTGTTAHFTGSIDSNFPAGPFGDEEAAKAAYATSWHFECTPECPGLQGGTIPADSPSHDVEAVPTGLQPNTPYEVSLIATNAGGTVTKGPVTFKTNPVAPEVQTLYAGTILTDSAGLAAEVNPKNSPATYQFEWGTSKSYGSVVPAEPQALGFEDNASHFVTASLSGLAVGTKYHFRIVATNTDSSEVARGTDHTFTTLGPAAPPSPCANAAFRIGPSSDLPDCRAYERVSPSDKNGFSAAEYGFRSSSPSGNEIALSMPNGGVPPGSQSGPVISTLLARRSPSTGWTSTPIDPPMPPGSGFAGKSFFAGFLPDRSKSLLISFAKLTPDATEFGYQLYIRDNSTGTYQLLTPRPGPIGPNPLPNLVTTTIRVAGYTSDLSRVLYDDPVAQTDDPVISGYQALNAYEWVAGQGVRLVGVLPDGSIPATGSQAGAGMENASHALSADGSRAFFHVVESGTQASNSFAGQIYVRDDRGTTTTDDDTTVHVSASERTDCADHDPCSGAPEPDPAGPFPALFWTAEATHGSEVLFTSCEKLTDDSTAHPAPDCSLTDYRILGNVEPGRDLYSFDADTGDLTDLTTADPSGANVFGVVGSSDDLNRIYFVAGGVLATGAIAGEPNLYLDENGTTKFIATLRASDDPISDNKNWSARYLDRLQVTRASSDGQYLLFTSRARLTNYDSTNTSCPDGSCSEVYLYGASTGELTCVSCDPGGAAATGDATLMSNRTSLTTADSMPRNLLDDGSRVYFQTPQSLVQADSNGRQDVYQYQDGHVGLISSGTSDRDSFFADASALGDNVFFSTFARLESRDIDGLQDIYDARIGGGFAALPSATPCYEDACQGDAPTTPRGDVAPGSTGFVGGNEKATVKRRRARHRRHHRNHSKRHLSRTKGRFGFGNKGAAK